MIADPAAGERQRKCARRSSVPVLPVLALYPPHLTLTPDQLRRLMLFESAEALKLLEAANLPAP